MPYPLWWKDRHKMLRNGAAPGPSVITLTAVDLDGILVGLRAAQLTWRGLIEQYGSLDELNREIDTTEWLRGSPSEEG